MEKCIIIGAGPAGYTAAIYAARANLGPLVLTGIVPGGQLTTTTEVENFPGFPEGIQGPELMDNMAKQAARFGARLVNETVNAVDLRGKVKSATTEKGTYQAQAVIAATGAQSILLGIPGEKELMGKGVSTCATCDGFFYRGKEIAVVGGGDSAMEEATFLTKFASKVTVIHRRDQLRASKIMQERARQNPKIALLLNAIPLEMLGRERLTAVRVKDVKSGKEQELKLDGIFIAIGHKPSTDIFRGQLAMDEQGYLSVHEGTKTNLPGVFAAGDVHDSRYRQAITAAGSGCQAALDAEHYLQSLEA
jgi:thioredoxin reductase (NADPH)